MMRIIYFFYSILVLFKKKHKIKVQKIIQIDAYTQTIWFDMPKNFKWKPGSSGLFCFDKAFSNFIIDVRYMRWMTVARSEDKTYLEITCRVPGSNSLFKQSIMSLEVGSEMILYNVHSHCPLIRTDKHLVFLSMGIGSTTFKNLFESYEENQEGILSITSINVDNHRTNLYYNQFPLVNKIYTSNRLEFQKQLDHYLNQPETIFYIVGSEDFLHEMINKLKNSSIHIESILIDRSRYMRKKYYKLR